VNTKETRINELIRELSELASPPYVPTLDNFVPGKTPVLYAGPSWDSGEISAGLRSFLTGKWLTAGEKSAKFEIEFSKHVGTQSSVFVNSGSSANLVMMLALKKFFELDNGDEVIVPVSGFPTTVAPIEQAGLTPKFADIDINDMNWNEEKLVDLITPRTKAIIASPFLGNPGNFVSVIEEFESRGITVLLDGCDSLSTVFIDNNNDRVPLNRFSRASTCSFYPAHHITTGEGGMVSGDKNFIKIARSIAWWGRSCYCVGSCNKLAKGTCGKRFDNWIPDIDMVLDHRYVYDNIGLNVKPLDMQAAIGIVQLEKANMLSEKRRSIKNKIDEAIKTHDFLTTIDETKQYETSWFGTPIICKTPEIKVKLVAYLENAKIQTRNNFAGNLLVHPGYRHMGDYKQFPVALDGMRRVFFVGASPLWTDEVIDYIVQTIVAFRP
jgi:CDP-6-deoxy-D-xylo-4-hexulose-3-dehydrase